MTLTTVLLGLMLTFSNADLPCNISVMVTKDKVEMTSMCGGYEPEAYINTDDDIVLSGPHEAAVVRIPKKWEGVFTYRMGKEYATSLDGKKFPVAILLKDTI